MTYSKQRRLLLRSIAPVGTAAALGTLGLLGGCGDGSSGSKRDVVTEALRDVCLPPLPIPAVDVDAVRATLAQSFLEGDDTNQADTFRNVDLLHTTRPIAQNRCRGDALERDPRFDLSDLRYTYDAQSQSVDNYMARNRTAGLLVLKDGKVVLERYGMGQTETAKWTSFSLTKSFTGTLAGAAVQDGQLALWQSVAHYLGRDATGRYADVPIENLLRMRSGIGWQELDISRLGQVFLPMLTLNAGRKGDVISAVVQQVQELSQDAGASAFRYSTPDSIMLGAVIQAATGQPLNAYLQEKIWEPAGMAYDGYWLSESTEGIEIGGAGISATLQDFGRFGQFILTGAKGRDGKSILPPGWARSAYFSGPGGGPGQFVRVSEEEPHGYGYQWWIVSPDDAGRPADTRPPIFYASGLMGQRIFIDPVSNVVMVILSAWPMMDLLYAERNIQTLALLRATIQRLS
ncbi:serine hydrolase [Robbsia sp. KACC 23696]|uniref:serine hydrolase domain-containing protein n=1 Tax=Robbsia sp. KACC 23696 TaxID=3149231 RepID=UPI00325C14E6